MKRTALAWAIPLTTASVVGIGTGEGWIGGGAVAQSARPDLVYERFGERRAYFRAWLAACRPGGYCSTISYNGAGPDAAGVDADYLLRVGAPRPGDPFVITFTTVASTMDPNSKIDVSIDGRAMATLERNGAPGWEEDPRIANEFSVTERYANDTLLPAMKAGYVMDLAFTDTEGRRRVVRFSLLGLTGALGWLDGARQS